MEKVEEKKLKKENMEETKVIETISEIIPKEKNVEDTEKETIKKSETQIIKTDSVPENKPIKKKKTRKLLIILLILTFLFLFAVIFSTIFSLLNINNNKIMSGININGIDISNLTKQEAINLLNNKINNNEENYITVTRKGITETICLDEIGAKFKVEDAVNDAYKIGREGNIIKCNYDILFAQLFKKSMPAVMQYDSELLKKKVDEISLKMPDVALNSSYTIKDGNIIIKNSTDGVKIKEEEFKQKTIDAFSSNNKQFEIPVEKAEKEEIDINKIHDEIYKEAKDAYYTTNPYKVYKEEEGLDFAISIDEAKKILAEEKEEYLIPIKVLKPSVTVKNLDSGAFPNLLGTFTTYYGTGDSGRCYNIYLAAKSITETVVMPGETFSFNDLIGECSTRTGYRESTIYLNGKLSKGIGGGICQASTTLYNAVLRANLEIVERRNHSMSVTYVPLGHDAMVSIGSSDFKFKNNREYPIKVVASTGTGSITCQIYGLKTDNEYEVKLDTKVISKTAAKTKTQTYKVLYQNGKEVSRTLLSTDTYKAHQ